MRLLTTQIILPRTRTRRRIPGVAAAAVLAALTTPLAAPAAAVTAPVGSGFTITASDLSFILKQIRISERHAATLTASNPCGTLVAQPGDGIPDGQQIPDRLTPYGLRTVDGSCNNLFPATTWNRLSPLNSATAPSGTAQRGRLGAADEPFPRLAKARFRDAEGAPAGFFGPGIPVPASSSYAQKKGEVFDSAPRVVSNLIVDQTSTNPAAVAAAQFPVRTQGDDGVVPCRVDPDPTADPEVKGEPEGCVPTGATLDIPNVTTDVGLSPPYNSMFTFFGQFFDHGLDQTVKGGGTVFVPLKADDPLRTLGPDHKAGTGDEVKPSMAFMVLTRAQNQPGPDGVLGDDPTTKSVDESADDVQDAVNTDSPWIDLSQAYASHASHQVFLREYSADGPDGIAGTSDDRPVSTGKLLAGLGADETYPGSPDGTTGMATWASVKRQAAEKLGLLLSDLDVLNVPMLATDPYGEFLPGPHGLPQYVLKDNTLVEGDLAHPVPVPADVRHFDTPFLTDIAHNADPTPQDLDHNPRTAPTAPAPDADEAASADFAKQPAGTYDDEMLDAHFIAGDGRVNENIALTSIHQVFASEHDRLVDDITAILHRPGNAGLLAAFENVDPDSTDKLVRTFTYGDRIFQAARFVNEMEYQHLVFEEFGRKMAPAIRPFHVYSPDIDPSVQAEFAHAVYRFGHSMLDDGVARVNVDPVTHAKTDNSLPLLDAFLNPPEYFDNVGDDPYTPEQAAGAVVMGSVDQVGNEIDEFVVETLRNNLLGLPLDLPTLNITRAREAGVPTLNEFRRSLFQQTNDGRLAPYESWSDFGQSLKHPESLVNFVAAYGAHPTITGAKTLAAKRDAARALVDPRAGTSTTPGDVQPEDAADFMFGTGAWADRNGVPSTGLEDVDLWVGGLAEHTAIGGGLLGSTFDYVFQTQLENLQDGDRLYYLNRTPGLNLRTQLEGNAFAEIIERNTDGTDSLKADVFASADCTFQLANIVSPYDGSPTSSRRKPLTGTGSVNDDPSTPDCDENQLLVKQPDGTIAYRTRNAVDPSGINGQGVYNGTSGADRVKGGIDNDTFWGGDAGDVIQGNYGDDVAVGGGGDDIETDAGGADVLKGGPGDDAADAGPGDDILMGGDGQDVLNGGANDNEEFAGPGNDFVLAGDGADVAFGDGGDDWIEGGSGQDLLQGDHGAPFFDDPGQTAPGNDVLVGQVGENDYDAEGGDDVMAQNAAIDRNAGAGGWDWAIHQYDTVAADDDLAINNNLGPLVIQAVVNRDRWQETEADSGSAFDDVIKGNDDVPVLIAGGGFSGCNALDQAGLDRVSGLDALVPPLKSTGVTAADLGPLSAAGECPLTGAVWGQGNILLGGAGSDTLEGRGADDIIDGDQALSVRISVRTDPADPATEIGSTDLMGSPARRGTFGPGTAGMTLQKAVFSGLVDPGNLVAVREITSSVTAAPDCGAARPLNCDTVVFSGPRWNYSVDQVDGALEVTQTGDDVVGQKVSDGTDRVTGVERLRFSDGTVTVAAPAAPTDVAASASLDTGEGSAIVTWTPPAGADVTGFQVVVSSGGSVLRTVDGIYAGASSTVVTDLAAGTAYTFTVRAENEFGASPLSAESNPVTPIWRPGAPTGVTATRGDLSATVSWTAPADDGGSPITGYVVVVMDGNGPVDEVTTTGSETTTTVTGLVRGRVYTVWVAAVTAAGRGGWSEGSNTIRAASLPGAPVIRTATPGPRGGALTAVASWARPSTNGGAPLQGYRVTASQMAADGTTVLATTTRTVGAAARTLTFRLAAGRYRFSVVAVNAIGDGVTSARSNQVAAR